MKISTIISALRHQKVNCSIVGGCAVALHGIVRGTIDLDLLIEHTEQQFVNTELALTSLGFISRLPVTATEVFRYKKEYIENRNLTAWSFYKPHNPMEVVDIVITKDLRALTSVTIKAASFSFPVLSLPDLIEMKRETGRPQDLEDLKLLETLYDAHKSKT
jgi:hypothetical protein